MNRNVRKALLLVIIFVSAVIFFNVRTVTKYDKLANEFLNRMYNVKYEDGLEIFHESNPPDTGELIETGDKLQVVFADILTDSAMDRLIGNRIVGYIQHEAYSNESDFELISSEYINKQNKYGDDYYTYEISVLETNRDNPNVQKMSTLHVNLSFEKDDGKLRIKDVEIETT
ncbi:MAG: hypothetical protein RBT15_09790 [Gudongella sp.]|jgi:hypothetical protein|nr:hypothetical protein [Gudongella sp.]